MNLPIVKRIAPELTCSRKSIRRTPCHCCRPAILIELKELRICPGICTVQCHIYGNIPDDTDSLLICILFQPVPLFSEHILLELIEFHFFGKLLSIFLQCLRLSGADIVLPLQPADIVKRGLHRHIQTIVLQPVRILPDKFLKFGICANLTILPCLPQHLKSGMI